MTATTAKLLTIKKAREWANRYIWKKCNDFKYFLSYFLGGQKYTQNY
jgi:hypothetical protein